ncbi:MAG: hypothetical protein H0U49_10200 [Parachlamydiaceae bacterium]|nr:hypothetical protein [Parachlamydiaceae bacterium]
MPKLNSFFFIILFMTCFSPRSIFAEEFDQKESQLPADVSFVVVDIKYNAERGAQICEIQHGISSSFKGETFSNGGYSLIAQNLVKELDRFHERSWASNGAFFDPSLKQEFLNDRKWNVAQDFISITKNKQFLVHAAAPVYDPADLNSYHGFVIMRPGQIENRKSFRKKYPGIICIDNATYSNRKDKYKVTNLLMGDPSTEKHKPKWGLYSLENEEGLIERINKDIGSDLLVIKPLHGSLGNGVIILKKEDLQEALEYLFKRKPQGAPNIDPAYEFWLSCNSESFLVEEFIEVEPVSAPHLEGKLYSPTLRLAFLMIYNKKEIEIVCLGGYYSLPNKSLCEEGTLNERYKTTCQLPYYLKGDPEIMKLAEEQIKEVLHILYQKLLGLYILDIAESENLGNANALAIELL